MKTFSDGAFDNDDNGPPKNEIDRRRWILTTAFRRAGLPLEELGPLELAYFDILRGLGSDRNEQKQDAASRRAVEDVVRDIKKLQEGLRTLFQQSARTDVDDASLNLAKFTTRLLDGFGYPKEHDGLAVWRESIDHVLNWLNDAAYVALESGIKAPKGFATAKTPYMAFVRRLYRVWRSKNDKRGFSKRGGSYDGPFLDLLAECEALLPQALCPKTQDARGKRVKSALSANSDRLFGQRTGTRLTELVS